MKIRIARAAAVVLYTGYLLGVALAAREDASKPQVRRESRKDA